MVKMTIGKSDEQDMGLKGRELTGSRPPPKELRLASGGGKPGFNPPEKTGKKQAGVHANLGNPATPATGPRGLE